MTKRRRKRSAGKKYVWLWALFIIFLLCGCMGIWWKASLKPVSEAAGIREFEVKKGMTASQIAASLEKDNLIRSSGAFRLLCRLEQADSKINAGVYYLSGAMSSREILDLFLKGVQPEVVKVTIPEGYTTDQIIRTLVDHGLGSEADFRRAMEEFQSADYAFLAGAPQGKNHLEGFLFPDTYFFAKGSKPQEVIKRFLQRFQQELTPDVQEKLKEKKLSVREWVIKASLVEREAVKQEERALIAGVFENRLRIGMALQSCATVQYILGEAKPVLTLEDIAIDSPYNTYKYTGLPPGPIANPGHASLEAALNPAQTDYLYFAAKNDGSHAFSVTLAEHNRNVQIYVNK